MPIQLYRIRRDAQRLVAVPLTPQQAAESLDGGRPVLLATAEELRELARRHRQALIVIASQATAVPPGERMRAVA